MADGWTDDELRAAVAAYLAMWGQEQRGKRVNKTVVRTQLRDGPLAERSSSSIELRMRNISHVMATMGHMPLTGYIAAENVGAGVGERLRAIITEALGQTSVPLLLESGLRPIRTPLAAKASRRLQPTGYWTFQVNPRRWDAYGWLAQDEHELLFLVAEDDAELVQAGDLAIMRVNAYRGRPAEVVAILEVLEEASVREDPDKRFYADKADGIAAWRTRLRSVMNLGDKPIPVTALPDRDEFRYLRQGLQRSTTALDPAAFQEVARLAGLDSNILEQQRQAEEPGGIKKLERLASDQTPTQKERISKFIERGSIGKQVKEKRQGRCQVCDALSQPPVAFLKMDQKPYSEAHHVMPVSKLLAGSLAASNIMVLCPNHHRQAHHGAFGVIEHRELSWLVRVDDHELVIEKTNL